MAWTLVLLVLLALRLTTLARPAGGDQGLYTYVAQRVLEGDVPYRDAWEQKPPGVFLVYAVAWVAWPRTSLVPAADLVAAGLIALMLVLVGRRMFGNNVGEAAAVIFLLLGDPGMQRHGGMYVRAQCETFIALAVLGALVFAWRSSPRPWHGLVAGAGIAMAFWLKYNAIVFAAPLALATVLAATEATQRRRVWAALSWITAGGLAASLFVLAYFAATGALNDLWLATIAYNVRYSGETYAGPIEALAYLVTMPFQRAHVDGLWFVGLLGAVLLVAFRQPGSRLRDAKNRATIVALAWIAAAMLSIAINGSRGLPQYFVQAGPALALAASAGLATAWRMRQRMPMSAIATGALLLAGAWRVGVEGGWSRPRLFGVPQSVANIRDDVRFLTGGLPRTEYLGRFDRGDGGKYSPELVERLARHIVDTTHPTDSVYVFGFASGAVLARAERASASRFFWSRPVVLEFAADHPGYGSAGLLADLQRNKPAVVALQKLDWGLAEATTPNSIGFFLNHALLRAWLDAGYERDYEDAAFSVWRRKS